MSGVGSWVSPTQTTWIKRYGRVDSPGGDWGTAIQRRWMEAKAQKQQMSTKTWSARPEDRSSIWLVSDSDMFYEFVSKTVLGYFPDPFLTSNSAQGWEESRIHLPREKNKDGWLVGSRRKLCFLMEKRALQSLSRRGPQTPQPARHQGISSGALERKGGGAKWNSLDEVTSLCWETH